jgi:hypothetical protein
MKNSRLAWARHSWGRALLHLTCLCKGGSIRFHLAGLWRQLREGIFIALVLAAATGCDVNKEPADSSRGMVTQGSPPRATGTEADAQLAELTRELRRWIVQTKQRPASFEEFVAGAKIAVPPPPPGRKYVISKEMRVVLADR